MNSIHLENIIKSFFLGLFIGVILQLYDGGDMPYSYQALSVLASGSVGFIIGFITEWLTSVIPISLARARTYFFINNLIALIVAAFILAALVLIAGGTTENEVEFMPSLWIVLGIICAANLFDYFMYRRAQHKLKAFKAGMKDKGY